MSRANPNPICHVCGRPTRTLDYNLGSRNRNKLGPSWVTICCNTKCANYSSEGAIIGHGPTMKAARDDYRAQAAKLQGEQRGTWLRDENVNGGKRQGGG